MNRSRENFNQHGSRERFNDSQSNTLPRPRGKRSLQEEYYGSLPRPNRGGRPRTYSGGDNGGSLRGRGRGRGRESQAPSLRRINRQREHRKDSRERRAQSVPKQDASGSFEPMSTSMTTIWSPDGRCPSFADMLKKNFESEERIDRGNYSSRMGIFLKC